MTAANCNYDSREIITVAAIKSSATVLKGKLGGVEVELMLDSGSSVSLVQSNILQKARNVTQVAARPIELVTASGDQLPILQHVKASVQLGSQDAAANDTGINRETPGINQEAPNWPPPSVDHVILPLEQAETYRYPQRFRRPPDRYRP
ncbi:uncharacterized protein [Dysidea avara]|uniref:uncharacterized protein n=1 Tax=Dysidea avara TaxID=196820 RepID=UPI0033233522